MSDHDDTIFTAEDTKDFEYVRLKRLEVVEHLTKDGVPTNTRLLELELMALKDIDDSAVKKARLRVSKDSTDSSNSNATIIAGILSSMDRKLTVTDASIGEIPDEVPDAITDIDLTPEELGAVNAEVTPKDLKKAMKELDQ